MVDAVNYIMESSDIFHVGGKITALSILVWKLELTVAIGILTAVGKFLVSIVKELHGY
jgi:hypothetical protein